MNSKEVKESLVKVIEEINNQGGVSLRSIFTIIEARSIVDNISLLESFTLYKDILQKKNTRYKYPNEFNEKLKASIRERDNYICQVCGRPQKERERKLAIHHITYDKNTCDGDKLATTCIICNSKINGNRDKWIKYFLKKPISQFPLPLYLCGDF